MTWETTRAETISFSERDSFPLLLCRSSPFDHILSLQSPKARITSNHAFQIYAGVHLPGFHSGYSCFSRGGTFGHSVQEP
jgi:hypothetical protein